MSHPKNVIYAQAGGVTAVINASAAGVIEMTRHHPETFGKTYAAINGIVGVLEERMVDTSELDEAALNRLKTQPGAAFQACRFDLDTIDENPAQYERVLEVFRAYDIGYFFYNGGNGSMLTAQKVADYCSDHGHPVTCIGVAKTIDNDLALSHCSPGFGSAAKYIATSLLEATMDLFSMHNTSTKFFVLEAMGRNTGWLTIAGGLIKTVLPDVPLIVLPAERAFDQKAFLERVETLIETQGYCVCIVSEGLTDADGNYISIENIEHTQHNDYTQLGGVAHSLSGLVANTFNCKTHSAVPDYLQRSASHMVSETDWEMAYRAGKAAVQAALDGHHGVLPTIDVTSHSPLEWRYQNVDLYQVAELEKRVPDAFLTDDGMDITQEAIDYLQPLIKGERPVKFYNGLPDIAPIHFDLVSPMLSAYKAIK
ncbi:Pyrophosphate--fructose 6-phosphate 1-phosphotransferase [Hydrogenovibrio crunogenus]|uniref:Pyrophosphate--fructose 6-phosphate 1-phosphotransferase n=1 Tax=Hydrogenovibrio crunogenus TaxID=39765 RepID=A0A4P7P0W1_9GAMM|nr:6-phosphofructokinase [Hydrogenovibrio crunogenus]QBZ83616.1 Pyrophosphate--fructose 6-phosphate 1-phosphotransferase [Hydrogenovibrio crunogenus]RUM92292.1 MAG: 6-phosphofructokinase [Thiomicrospira sp.]